MCFWYRGRTGARQMHREGKNNLNLFVSTASFLLSLLSWCSSPLSLLSSLSFSLPSFFIPYLLENHCCLFDSKPRTPSLFFSPPSSIPLPQPNSCTALAVFPNYYAVLWATHAICCLKHGDTLTMACLLPSAVLQRWMPSMWPFFSFSIT